MVARGRGRDRQTLAELLIIVVTTLRYGSRTPGLVVKDVATTWHGSRMPRWLEGASGREESTAEGIGQRGLLVVAGASLAVKDRFRTEETRMTQFFPEKVRSRSSTKMQRAPSAAPMLQIWFGEHGRRSREVDLCSRSLRGGAAAIGRDVLTVEIEQRGGE
ncbi:hypothetical protein BHE74_00007768 [Ensete ventricosum]|nr:hypothetical protein BHE74_00007768 [Ensete ventricosum]